MTTSAASAGPATTSARRPTRGRSSSTPGTPCTPPQDGYDESDDVQRSFLEDEAIRAQLADTPSLDDIDPSEYDAVVLVGGHGTMWDFPGSTALAAVGRDIYESGGVVAAVCHGPSGLVN